MPGDHVESGGGFIEHQNKRTPDQGARNEHSARFTRGHGVERLTSEVARAHALEGLSCQATHLVGHVDIEQHALRRKEARNDRVFPADRAGAMAGNEASVQIARHDADLLPQFKDVPRVTSEDTHRRLATKRCQRSILERQQVQQRRLAGTVRTQDGGVRALVNRQRQAIEGFRCAFDDRRVGELKQGLGHGWAMKDDVPSSLVLGSSFLVR